MPMEVEVSLRVPNMKIRALDEHGYPIDHSAVRFRKLMVVPSIPKPGEILSLTTRIGGPCQYANRSITQEEYAALIQDPDWEMKPLI
jgi:hypothetical protein